MSVPRARVAAVEVGLVPLPASVSHHLVSVLRREPGSLIEVFDDQGRTASATLTEVSPGIWAAQVTAISAAVVSGNWAIAASIPKGARADWMIEKLAELGTSLFIPLVCRRSPIAETGASRGPRWERLAEQAARQSGARVMRIRPLVAFADLPKAADPAGMLALHPGPAAPSVADALAELSSRSPTLLIGPEGGFDETEVALLAEWGVRQAKFGPTILRVETAAIAAATAAMLAWSSGFSRSSPPRQPN